MPHGGYPKRVLTLASQYLVSSQMPCYLVPSFSTYAAAAAPTRAFFTRHFTPFNCYIDAIGIPFTSRITAGTYRFNLGVFQAGLAPYYEPLAGLLNAGAWNTVNLASTHFDGSAASNQTYWLPLQTPAFSPAGNLIHIGGVVSAESVTGGTLRTRLAYFPGAMVADDAYQGVSQADCSSANGSFTACPMTYFDTTPANLPVGNGSGTGGLTGDSFGGAYGTGFWASENAGNGLSNVDYCLRVRPA